MSKKTKQNLPKLISKEVENLSSTITIQEIEIAV